MQTLEILAISDCEFCNGLGLVFDLVDYGAAGEMAESVCCCVEEQIPEDFSGQVEVLSTEQE